MDVRWSGYVFHLAFIFSFLRSTATFKQQGTCYFPEKWEGDWFQSGVRQPVVIKGPLLTSKGRCLGSEGDKFLLVDDKKACYRCVVIHEKHANVLQYKETFCHTRDSLPTLCNLITGDALLYSMFRENADAVPCPFRGPFTFTYNRGHGECQSPVSTIDSCTEDSKLLLNYQACPDVYGSESAVEELQCLATWKEGSARYLVGKIQHHHATSNEDRFRCFVYEKTPSSSENIDLADFKVAQSGDATCNGLFSATEGSRTMTLKKAPSINKCRFPSWMTNFNHWHTLDYSVTYSFHHRNSTLRISNSTGQELKVVCVQVKHPTSAGRNDGHVMLVTHFTMGCQSGFTCMSFYRRDMHVTEIQIGLHSKRLEDACSLAFFNKSNLPYVTLITTSPEQPSQPCPYMGIFDVLNLYRSEESSFHSGNLAESLDVVKTNQLSRISRLADVADYRFRVKRVDQERNCDSKAISGLVIGCNSIDTMEFHSECDEVDLITSYTCHGKWIENGTSYLITAPKRRSYETRRFCFMYRSDGSNIISFSASGLCHRSTQPGITGDLVFNITNTGKCNVANSTPKIKSSSLAYILIIVFYSIFLTNSHFSRFSR